MRIVLPLALLAAACYQPAAAVGVPCSPSGECPGEQTCDRSRPVPTCVDRLVDGGGGQDGFAVDGPVPDAPASDGPALSCPMSYVAVPGLSSRYRYSVLPATWLQAAADCADDQNVSTGRTHLAVLSSIAERNAIAAMNPGALAWFGLSDRKTEGTYVFVTAEPVGAFPPASGAPWGDGQPSGMPDFVDCIHMQNGTFDDQSCGFLFSYYCECDGFANDPTRY